MTKIALDKIAPDPEQPRKLFDAKALDELAGAIKANGLIQPITIRPDKKRRGHFIIVTGERRWRAHCLLRDRGDKRFTQIRCEIVKGGKPLDVKVAQLVENIARADMTILEEADAIAVLAKVLTVEEIAERTGMVEFRVRWRLQLLNLTPEIRKMVAGEQLDKQQAMEIARLPHREQTRIVQMINRRELVGWKAVRNAVEAILHSQTQADIFGNAGKPGPKDVAELKAMELKIARIVALVAAGWKDGQCIVAARVDPDRAALMGEQLANIRKAIIVMERELQNVTAQAKIVMAG